MYPPILCSPVAPPSLFYSASRCDSCRLSEPAPLCLALWLLQTLWLFCWSSVYDPYLDFVFKPTRILNKPFIFYLYLWLHLDPFSLFPLNRHRDTSTPIYSRDYQISQSCGSSAKQCLKSFRYGPGDVHINPKDGGEILSKWLWMWSDYWCQTGWFEYLRNCFSCNTVYSEWCDKQKTSSSYAGRNAFLMREVRGEGPDWLKLTVTQITTHYSYTEEHLWRHNTSNL